jgi:hypothetical protein
MSMGNNPFVRWSSLCLCLLLTFLTACSTSSPTSSPPAAQNPTPALSPRITGPTAPGLKNCQPASPIDNSSLGPEVQGTATNAELWGLIMSTTGVPPLANSEVKIVWRITGTGFFNIVALGPHSRKVPPLHRDQPRMEAQTGTAQVMNGAQFLPFPWLAAGICISHATMHLAMSGSR